jgi:hypothetical protein
MEGDTSGTFMTEIASEITAMDEEVFVGMITQTETNPYFVKMRESLNLHIILTIFRLFL